MSKSYVNYHAHSTYSLLDGHSKTKEYVAEAKRQGMPAACLTEHGNLFSMLDLLDACNEEGLKFVPAMEAYQARKTRFDRDEEERAGPANDEWDQRGPHHLTILAKNMAGYKNLIKLSSRAYLEGFYGKPRMDFELLETHSEGLVVLSGCLNGMVQQNLLRGDFDAALRAASAMQDIVGKENYFIEIQDHDIDEQRRVKADTIKIAKMIGAKIIPTCDCHYTHKEDSKFHDALICVSTGATIDQEKRFRFHGDSFYLKPYDEMATLFEEEWLHNTLDIADMVDVQPKFGELYFPDFPLPPGTDKQKYLEDSVWKGIKNRYGDSISEEVKDRTNYELGVVSRMGFVDYFLTVEDLVSWAKSNGIRIGRGRGSAAGAIISYALGITSIDPIKYGLMFERFLIEGRKNPPDIDIDVDDRYRDKLINYAREKYGYDHVAHIGTFSGVGAKSAIRDAARVLGYEYLIGDRIAKLVPDPVLGKTKSIKESLETQDFAKAYNSDDDVKKIVDIAMGLEGSYRQTGIHASGIVISKEPITEYVPVMLGGDKKDIIVTQWDMHRVEECGQLKIDFLGLRNLGVVDMCLEKIIETQGISIDIDNLPLDDHKTYEELRAGNSIGIFQIEGSGCTSLMRSLQPDTEFDIMALIALYRPGPMGSGMDQMYVDRKRGRKKIEVYDPKLKESLAASNGILLYQEDVISTCRILAGMSVEESDLLRRAIGKKEMDKISLYRKMFVDGCIKTSGISEAFANKIYSDIEYFAGYGFAKAHAASYGMLTYATAYLKAHYPTEYMAALLSSVTDDKNKMSLYLNECKRLAIKVLVPSVNKSKKDFTVTEDGDILFGLSGITGIGSAYVDAILRSQTREYKSIYEYLKHCDLVIQNKTILENLVGSGAFDELIPAPHQVRGIDRQDRLEVLRLEKQNLGLYVTDHPLVGVWDYLNTSGTVSLAELEDRQNGSTIKVAGIISGVNKRKTKRGADMYNLIFEDLTGTIEVVVFPRQASIIPPDFFTIGSIGVLSGKLNREGDEDFYINKIHFEEFEKFDTTSLHGSHPITLKSKNKLSAGQLKHIYDILKKTNGDSSVYIEFPEGDHVITLCFSETTSIEMEEALKQIVENKTLEFQF